MRPKSPRSPLVGLPVLLPGLAVGVVLASAMPASSQQITCYQLVRTISCSDDNTAGYCQASQRLDFFPQADGTILGTYRGGTPGDSCQIQYSPQRGTFTMRCPGGAAEWNWQPPPQVWCSDQDASLAAAARLGGPGTLSGKYWPYQVFQARPGGTSASGAVVEGRDPFNWITVDASQPANSGSVSGLRPLPGLEKFSIGVVISGYGAQKGGNATDSVGVGVEYAYLPIPPGAKPPAPPVDQDNCYRLRTVLTCADNRAADYCQASQRLDFFTQPDGSILGKYRGGASRDSCEIQFHPLEGRYRMTCPNGAGEWNWQPPPPLWCPDQGAALGVSATFRGTGKIEGRYWPYQPFQARPGGTSASGGLLSGRDPFTWLTAEGRGPQVVVSGSASDVRPLPGLDTFSMGVVISGFGIQQGGTATDSVGIGVEYVYDVPASRRPRK